MTQVSATSGQPQMLTVPEAAARLGAGPEQIRVLIRAGELAAIKIGTARNSHWRISEQAIEDYKERHASPARAAS